MLMRIEPVPEGFQLLLPRALVEACGLAGEVTVSVREQTLVVEKKPRPVREGWEEALRDIPQEALDRDFEELGDFRETPHEWDGKEWQWSGTPADEKV